MTSRQYNVVRAEASSLPHTAGSLPAGRHRAASAALAWSLFSAVLGLWWWTVGAGFPYGRSHDLDPDYSNLAALSPETGAPVIAVWALVAGLATRLLTRQGLPRWLTTGSVAVAWITAATLILIVPDFRVLIRVAYLPVLVLGAPFGWPPDVDYGEVFQWTVLNQFLSIAVGLAFAGAACGRRTDGSGWTSPEAAARWGRWATWFAVLLPFFYSITRWAWALGIPLGVTSKFLREEAEDTPMIWYAGAFLGSVGAGGGLLTLGLIRPWGERFPRWMGRLAGRRLPPRLAIIPASVIAVLIVETGIMYNRMALTGTWDEELRTGNWATVVPEMTWPIWGGSARRRSPTTTAVGDSATPAPARE